MYKINLFWGAIVINSNYYDYVRIPNNVRKLRNDIISVLYGVGNV